MLDVGMSQQKAKHGLRVRRDVKNFVAASACKRAGGDVANGVAASLARSDADGGETAHDCGRVFDVYVVKLKVLARGDVGDAIRIFFSEISHRFELLGVKAAARNLDALHAGRVPHGHGALGEFAGGILHLLDFGAVAALAVVVTLSVSAAAEARFGENALVELALLAESNLRVKNIDLVRPAFGNFSRELLRHE